MAKQMDFTTDAGLLAAGSYWICSDFTIDMLHSNATIGFTGFASAAALALGKAPIGRKVLFAEDVPGKAAVVNDKGDVVVPAVPPQPDFTNYFSPTALNTAGAQVSLQGYKFAVERSTIFAAATDVA